MGGGRRTPRRTGLGPPRPPHARPTRLSACSPASSAGRADGGGGRRGGWGAEVCRAVCATARRGRLPAGACTSRRPPQLARVPPARWGPRLRCSFPPTPARRDLWECTPRTQPHGSADGVRNVLLTADGSPRLGAPPAPLPPSPLRHPPLCCSSSRSWRVSSSLLPSPRPPRPTPPCFPLSSLLLPGPSLPSRSAPHPNPHTPPSPRSLLGPSTLSRPTVHAHPYPPTTRRCSRQRPLAHPVRLPR